MVSKAIASLCTYFLVSGGCGVCWTGCNTTTWTTIVDLTVSGICWCGGPDRGRSTGEDLLGELVELTVAIKA